MVTGAKGWKNIPCQKSEQIQLSGHTRNKSVEWEGSAFVQQFLAWTFPDFLPLLYVGNGSLCNWALCLVHWCLFSTVCHHHLQWSGTAEVTFQQADCGHHEQIDLCSVCSAEGKGKGLWAVGTAVIFQSQTKVFVSGHVMRCKRASWVTRLWCTWWCSGGGIGDFGV